MSIIISSITVAQELSLLAVIAGAVGCYLYVAVKSSRSAHANKRNLRNYSTDQTPSLPDFDDRQPLFWRHHFNPQNYVHYYISAFSAEILSSGSASRTTQGADTKICVSRSAQDTEKLLHPLQKKIESRLRRAELRPRPRLRQERKSIPYPLFSAIRPDMELTTYILNFLDACIDLSASCDTQVNFTIETDESGVSIAAVWRKNQLITDATAQIELLDNMRLTMSGELVRWEYQIFECPQNADLPESIPAALRAAG